MKSLLRNAMIAENHGYSKAKIVSPHVITATKGEKESITFFKG